MLLLKRKYYCNVNKSMSVTRWTTLYSHLHSQLSISLVIKFDRNPSCPESRALPRADSQVAGEEHVHEVLELVGHLEAEALTHDDVPGRTEPAGTNFDLFNGISYIFVHLK